MLRNCDEMDTKFWGGGSKNCVWQFLCFAFNVELGVKTKDSSA